MVCLPVFKKICNSEINSSYRRGRIRGTRSHAEAATADPPSKTSANVSVTAAVTGRRAARGRGRRVEASLHRSRSFSKFLMIGQQYINERIRGHVRLSFYVSVDSLVFNYRSDGQGPILKAYPLEEEEDIL
jgi:hypothetical protein